MQITGKIYNLQSLNFLCNCNLKVGILGGSFNPAHAGHLSISLQAIKAFNLDYIIWLVALQNPLKPSYDKDIITRASEAAALAVDPRIIVCSAELDINSCYLYDSLKVLTRKFPKISFSFIMGSDNAAGFHKWYRHHDIVKLCQILVFDRPGGAQLVKYNRFTICFATETEFNKRFIDKSQTTNIIIYRGIMSDISSSSIRNI